MGIDSVPTEALAATPAPRLPRAGLLYMSIGILATAAFATSTKLASSTLGLAAAPGSLVNVGMLIGAFSLFFPVALAWLCIRSDRDGV